MRFILQHVRLNSAGYDTNGAYWGHDKRLYWAYHQREVTKDNEYMIDDVNEYIRAHNREDAKRIIRLDHPTATFYN